MKRFHLIEIEDQEWCPRTLRNGTTDFLQSALGAAKPYAAVIPILATALERAGASRVIDLCSGAAGPWIWLRPALVERGLSVSVCLTDKYPNPEGFAGASRRSNPAIRYHPQSVDATRVPQDLPGFRTMFTGFHHFRPDQALAVLADAVRTREGIAVFEATQRRPAALLLMLVAPLAVLVMTPWIRPFRWSRLLWTYLLPMLPLVTLFDALVSCLRTYSVRELHELTARLGTNGYRWEIGTLKGRMTPIPITYLIGVPTEPAD